jgi:formate dehydrogenase subunit gamma
MIERYNLKERLVHWAAAITYLYVAATGLAFYSPHFYWLAQVLGGGPTSRYWHPIVGLVFVGTVLWMWAAWKRDMALTAADAEWQKAIKYYITHQDDKVPKAGRFNAGQKQFFWIMLFAGLILVLSGVVLWWTDLLPWSLRWLRYTSVLLHVVAFLATVAGFIVHVYMGVFVIPGGLKAITSSRIPRAWVEAHHPLSLADKK